MSESPSETPEHPTGPGDPPRDLHGGGESVSRAVSGETIESGDASSTDASDDGLLGLPPVRYPNAYVWYVFLSTMDILFTWMILTAGGREVNPVAQWFLDVGGVEAMIGFKFAMVVLVVVICEVIGAKREALGRRVADWAVALTAIPVMVGGYLLFSALLTDRLFPGG